MLGNGAGRGCPGKGWVAKPGRAGRGGGEQCTLEGCVVTRGRGAHVTWISSSVTLPLSRCTLQTPLTSSKTTGRGEADEGVPSREVKTPADITLPLPGGRDYITLDPFTDGPGSWDLVGPPHQLPAQSQTASVWELESESQAFCPQSPCSSHHTDKGDR